jgi:hypothetical protein
MKHAKKLTTMLAGVALTVPAYGKPSVKDAIKESRARQKELVQFINLSNSTIDKVVEITKVNGPDGSYFRMHEPRDPETGKRKVRAFYLRPPGKQPKGMTIEGHALQTPKGTSYGVAVKKKLGEHSSVGVELYGDGRDPGIYAEIDGTKVGPIFDAKTAERGLKRIVAEKAIEAATDKQTLREFKRLFDASLLYKGPTLGRFVREAYKNRELIKDGRIGTAARRILTLGLWQ